MLSSSRTLPLVGLLLALAHGQEVTEVQDGDASGKAAPKGAPPTVDLCICLDTSGSMQKLIDSARARIWSIVNDLALANPTPRLRVALIAYGGRDYNSDEGWIAVQTGFTEDLDLVSQKLFALHARGSTEYVGRALETALSFDWQEGSDSLKLVVVAGNESADQDPQVPFRGMCRKAIASGVMVNPFYCGDPAHADAPGWKEIATLSDGHYAVIEQGATVRIETPFDKKIAALSKAINETYVPLGKAGREGRARQSAADKDAGSMGADTEAVRGNAKASKLYWNRWCLVDRLDRGQVDLKQIKDEDLPEEMRGLTLEEKRAYLDAKRKKREEIQAKIKEVNAERTAWLTAEKKRRSIEDKKSFKDGG